mgnify:CR=1 FL=1
MEGTKMSNSCWTVQLSESLKNPVGNPAKRIAIVGVGAELNGDDAVGVLIARKLMLKLARREEILVFDSGTNPENAAGPLRMFQPDFVLFVDAAGLGRQPGKVSLLDLQTVTGASFSTHSLPISVFLKYLREEIKCEVAVLGIQPQSVEFGAGLSEEGKQAVSLVADSIFRVLSE